MQIGDLVEVRVGDAVLGRAHIAGFPAPSRVSIKGVPRVLPTKRIEAQMDDLRPKPGGGWVLDLRKPD
jgi:hypothetical protein